MAEEATLLEVVELGTRCRTALGGSAVVDMVGERELLEGMGHSIWSVVSGRCQSMNVLKRERVRSGGLFSRVDLARSRCVEN